MSYEHEEAYGEEAVLPEPPNEGPLFDDGDAEAPMTDDGMRASGKDDLVEEGEHKKERKKRTKEEKAERRRRKKEKRERKKKEKEKREKELSQKRRRRQRVEGNEEDKGGEILSEEDENRPKKKRKAEMTESEAAETVRNVLDRMVSAADEDDEALTNRQPALSKLSMLDTVGVEIAKPKWVHWFLREGVCQVLGRWLAPLPGGGLPNITIRSRILQLLQKMPLYVEHLQGTNLGVRLIAMWKSSEELEENRVAIRDIVHALLRPVFGVKWSHRAADVELEESSIPKTPLTAKDRPTASVEPSRRARIPLQTGYSFKVIPKSNFKGMQNEVSRDSESTMARLSRMMAYKKTFGNRTARRAQNVSVSKSVL